MVKKSFIVSLFVMSIAFLPNSARAIFVHDSTNSIDHVMVHCSTKPPTRMPVYETPETKHLDTTGYWLPWAGSIGVCMVRLYKRIEVNGETQFKKVCQESLAAYQSVEHLGYGEFTQCYRSRSPYP